MNLPDFARSALDRGGASTALHVGHTPGARPVTSGPHSLLRRLSVVLTLSCTALPLAAAEPSAQPAPKILVLLAQGFNFGEFSGPTTLLRSLGYTVEVASPLERIVPVDRDMVKPNPERDVPVDLPMANARAADYTALFIPGGYSPGFLESNPETGRILRDFFEVGKPVGMICHGPRLLLRHGLASNRTFTCLFTVPDELADLWITRPFARYLDQPVVRDGNLLTARYPGDVPAFAWHFAEMLRPITGIDPPTTPEHAKRAAADAAPPPPRPAPSAHYEERVEEARVVLALRDGFDDETVLAALTSEAARRIGRIGVIAGQAGPVRGVSGRSVNAGKTYADVTSLKPGTVIIAPGFFWPQKNAKARQADQPAWIDQRETADAAREEWLLARRSEGATIVAVGLDALRLGNRPEFADKKFATTEQAVWSFPKGAGKYTKDPAAATDDRLITARGAADLDAAIGLIPQ